MLQQFHLVVDPLLTPAAPPGGPRGASRGPLKAFGVPDHPATLAWDDDASLRLAPATLNGHEDIVLEPVRHGNRPRLLAVVRPEGASLRINGHPAPLVALLDVGDQLLHGERLLHVTLYQEPPIGPPTAEQVGGECLLCRGPLARLDSVYTCSCGGVVHVRSVTGDDGQALECSTLTKQCPRCSRPLILTEGFSHVPALD